MSITHDDVTRAARTMIAVEPPTDLEERIKQRLDAQALTRPTTMRWPVMAGLAVATATAIAVTIRSSEVPESRGPAVHGEVPGSRSPEVPPTYTEIAFGAGLRDTGTSALRNTAVDRGTPGPRDFGTSIRRSDAELAWMSRAISPLVVIDPLAMDRLTLNSIQPDTLSISPLTITPLVTTPVTGDGDAGRQH